MGWLLEDSVVDGLFCAHSKARGGLTPFAQTGAETSDAAKPDPRCTWEGGVAAWRWRHM